MVPLAQECSIVKAYIRSHQLRFFNQFTVAYDFEEQKLEEKVPQMILPPLVENTIYYGLEQKSSNRILSSKMSIA